MKFFSTLFISCLFISSISAQLNCTDCPNGTFIGGILTSELEVVNEGPDDIGQNPLTEVCITLNHSWLSDVAISLESPDGVNYLLLGDDDNSWGGCWSSTDSNVDVCFVLGDETPLTSGDSYENYCSGTTACLEGDYTLTCGPQATSPDGLALEAPNCDLNDYNITGNTISGNWTLRVYCVCEAEAGGLLVNWSLGFQAPNNLTSNDNSFCNAYAGYSSSNPGVAVCNNGGTLLSYDPSDIEYIPSGQDYGYANVLVNPNNGEIQAVTSDDIVVDDLDLGIYFLYGLSYHMSVENELSSYIGEHISLLSTEQGIDDDHCFHTSVYYKFIEVTESAISYEDHALCGGESAEIYGVMYDTPGTYSVDLNDPDNCYTSAVITIQQDDGVSFEKIYPFSCPGDIVEIASENGTVVEWTGPNGFTSNDQNLVFENSNENLSGTYTCTLVSELGCTHVQTTELSLRCETRVLAVELGQQASINFEDVISTMDECSGDPQVLEMEITEQIILFTGLEAGTDMICLQVIENGVLKNLTYEVTVEDPLSDDEPAIAFEIRPNPVSDIFQIDAFGVQIENLEIYDTKGSMIRMIDVNDSQKTIRVEDLASGLYVLRIQTAAGVLNRKILVQ